MISRLEIVLFNMLNQEQFSNLDQQKLKFGIEIMISEIYKIVVIYFVTFLLDCFILTLVTHLTFFFLRQVCLGYHFKNLYICIICSLLAFPFACYFISSINFNLVYLNISMVFLVVTVFLIGPRGTENQPIINQRHRSYLCKKITIRLIILTFVYSFSPLYIKVFIVYGVFLEATMLIIQIIKENILDEDKEEKTIQY